jgi:hypothetical protein
MKALSVVTMVLLTFFLPGCEKKSSNFDSDLYIRGRLFLLDTLTQNIRYSPIPDRKVLLVADTIDVLNYLYSDSTDKEGYFSFTLFSDAPESLAVRFEDTLNGFHYYGKAIVKKGSESAVLLATLDDRKHNGVLFTTKDDNFGLLPNVTLHIYNNKLLAELNAHQQAVFSFTTDKFGRYFQANLPPGEYYVNAEKQLDFSTLEAIAKPVTIGQNGFTTTEILLARKQANFNNGFIIALKDSANNAVSNASVHLFDNPVAAASNNVSLAIADLASDNLGIISKFNIPEGQYYLNATKSTEQAILYRLSKEIHVNANGIVNDTMILRR